MCLLDNKRSFNELTSDEIEEILIIVDREIVDEDKRLKLKQFLLSEDNSSLFDYFESTTSTDLSGELNNTVVNADNFSTN